MKRTDGEFILLCTLPVVALIWVFAFFLFPGFAHPMSPSLSAEEVATFYRDETARIRYSMILFNWFGVGLVPIVILLAMQIRRMAHRTPILSYCLIACAGGPPTIFWDHQDQPIFRPWVALFNVATAIAMAPAAFTALSFTGPLVWDGLLSFWVKNSAIAVWIVVMGAVLAQNIRDQRAQERVAA